MCGVIPIEIKEFHGGKKGNMILPKIVVYWKLLNICILQSNVIHISLLVDADIQPWLVK